MLLRWDDQQVTVTDSDVLEARLKDIEQSSSEPLLVSLAGEGGSL